jgi:hypothetical protein
MTSAYIPPRGGGGVLSNYRPLHLLLIRYRYLIYITMVVKADGEIKPQNFKDTDVRVLNLAYSKNADSEF